MQLIQFLYHRRLFDWRVYTERYVLAATTLPLLTAHEVVTWTSLDAAGDREMVAVIAFPSPLSTVFIPKTSR